MQTRESEQSAPQAESSATVEAALRRAVQLADAGSGLIAQLADGELEVSCGVGPPDSTPPAGSRLAADEELRDSLRSGRAIYAHSPDEVAGLLGVESLVALPLAGGRGSAGVLALGYESRRRFAPRDEPLFAAVADLCAHALEEARLSASFASVRVDTAAAERRARFLVEATAALGSSLDYRLTLRRLAQLVVPELADWCSVDMVEADGTIQSVALAHADPARATQALELRRRYPPLTDSAAGVANVIRTGIPEVYEEITDGMLVEGARSQEHLELMRAAGLRSAVIVPLVARRRTFGAITLVWADSGQALEPADVQVAEEVARRAALAVDNARLFNGERRARRQLERLQALTAALAETMTSDEVASVIVEQVSTAVGAAGAGVLLTGPDGTELQLVASTGFAPSVVERFRSLAVDADLPAAQAVREGDPIWLESLTETDTRYPALADVEQRVGRAFAALPLCSAAQRLGVIVLSFPEERAFGPDDRALLVALADQSAQAFERARLYAREHAARQAAERAGERLRGIQEVLEIGLTHVSLDALLQELLSRLRALIGTDAATILLLDEKGTELRVRASVGLGRDHFEDVSVAVGEGILGRLAAAGAPAVVDEISADERALPYLGRAARSLVGVPLLTREGVIGVLHLTTVEQRHFTDDEVGLLEAVAARAALAIERTRLYEREHEIAETLQRSMLPQELPEVPGLDLVGRYMPGSLGMTVGGDWYDALELPDGRIGIAVGDIVGKGLRAATEMVRVRNTFRAYALEGLEPADVLERLNGLAERQGDGQYSTLVYAVFDPRRSRLSFASAGHPPPLVRGPFGSVTYLEGGRSLPLGVAPELRCEESDTRLPTGATLLLYTDGLVERRESGITEGLLHLADAVQKGPDDLEQLVDGLIAEIVAKGLDDDIGIVALRPVAVPSHLSLGLPAEPKSLWHLRRELREWLKQIGVSADEIGPITAACNEACTNAIEHPLGPRSEIVQFEADVVDGRLSIVIRDSGRWRTPDPQTERGLGLRMIQDLMDSVEVNRLPDGTEVRMSRRVGTGA